MPSSALHWSYQAVYGSKANLEFERATKALGLPTMDALDLSTVKTSDRVFILGSGASINGIAPERWAHIKEHDSFGFNFWTAHDHVPSLYCYEAMHSEGISNSPEIISTFIDLASAAAPAYARVPKLVGDLQMDRLEMFRRLPTEWMKNTYAAPCIYGLFRNRNDLGHALGALDRAEAFTTTTRVDRLFKYRGTLTKLISLAVRMGYQKIVLCGIDLVTPDYFYQDSREYPNLAGFQSSPRFRVHATVEPVPFSLPIDQVVYTMNEHILKPRRIELCIEHTASGLYPSLPAYTEDLTAL